jgi:hypothetical protein
MRSPDLDTHSSENSDPDPHSSETLNLDTDPHYSDADPHTRIFLPLVTIVLFFGSL